jgi:ATP-dependent DNA helicase RecG (EC 3.6.1.-)
MLPKNVLEKDPKLQDLPLMREELNRRYIKIMGGSILT